MPIATADLSTQSWTSDLGISTLHNVQLLASKVARASDASDAEVVDPNIPSTSQPGERVQLALKSLEEDSEFTRIEQCKNIKTRLIGYCDYNPVVR